MKQVILFAVCFVAFAACSKNNDGVFIRIQNNTALNFKEVIANSKSFKNVTPSEITSYQHFESAIDLPTATLITNSNDTIYAGYLYFDALFSLADGKYTLKVFDDTSTISNFNCVYIKE